MVKSSKKIYAALGVIFSYIVIYTFLHGINTDVPNSYNTHENEIVTVSSQIDDSKPIIILDAGHGGVDGGCSAYNGAVEKDINLSIELSLKAILETFGYTVEVTRSTDISIFDPGIVGIGKQKKSDMNNRLNLFNKYENAVAVSIHQNQFTDPQFNGAQMFYTETNPLSQTLAQTLQNTFKSKLQNNNDREIKNAGKDLFLLYYSKCPSVMVECGFLSNKQEADLLLSKGYQKQVALTIFSGLNEFILTNYKQSA